MCVRRGDWKVIVGHHEVPYIFPQVYTEPEQVHSTVQYSTV